MKFKSLIFAFLILLLGFNTTFAATATESFNACVKKLSGAKSVKAEFTSNISGKSVSGSIKSKGRKFYLTAGGVSTWYNGKDMWSYNPASKEVTVWHPTASELAETNPLLYLSTASQYNVKEGKGAKGEAVVILTPKRRGSGVKQVTVKINTSTNLPKSMSISASGGNYSATFKSINLGAAVSDSEFNFPSSKYKGVTISDLR